MPTVLTCSLLLAGTIFLTAISWRSLHLPRFHGFSRFFAFEAILAIIVLNAPFWFHRPLAPLQLVSWSLLILSLGLAVYGFHVLRRLGRPSQPDSGSPLFHVENTTVLVTTGAYRFIRHPLYASLLYLAWGAALKSLTPVVVLLTVLAAGFLVATAKSEEVENIGRFGEAYREYMAHTRLFIPFVL
jgi:protein-S-isoprenylcysteine O-methyltransferase Ste14